MRGRSIATATALVLALAACGGDPGAPATPTTPAAGASGQAVSGEATVEIKDFTFTPAALTVTVGTKVTWKFTDSAKHNVKSDDGSFRSEDLSDGKTYSHTFDTAGEFPYICSLHQYMTASVTVR